LGFNVWYFNMLSPICGHTLPTKLNRRLPIAKHDGIPVEIHLNDILDCGNLA
jgi:hypothetical protein